MDDIMMSGVKAALDAAKKSVTDAAENASKPGGTSSEFKVVVGSTILAAVVAGLHAVAVIPGPWTLPALILSGAVAAGSAAYSVSRGNVKAAALTAAADVLKSLPPLVQPPPPK
jgi:fatty acid desaturase